MRSPIVKKLLLLLITTLISLALAEVFLRIFRPQPKSIYELDQSYLHRLIPNSSKVFVHHRNNGGVSVPISINSYGFRDREFALPGNPETKRIVIYGDSFIEAEFSPTNETLAKQLERQLAKTGAETVEVINAGVVAYGPDQIDLRIGRETELLRPDLVIVAITGNDFGDLLRNKIYRLNSENHLVRNQYWVGNSLKAQFQPPKGPRTWSLFKQLVRRVIKSPGQPDAEFLESPKHIERSLKWCKADYEEYVVRNDNEVKTLFRDQFDADIALEPESASAQHKIKLLEQVLVSIQGKLTAKQIPFVILIIPTATDTCPDYHVQIDASVNPKYDPSALTSRVAEIAARQHIRHLNLYADFKAQGGCPYYFKYPDSHWNARGQARAAELLKDFITAENLLAAHR